MARGPLKDKQIDILARALLEGKTQVEACALAGLSITNSTRTCSNHKVQARMTEIEAEQERKEQQRDLALGVKEPMTIKEYQAFLEKRMLDENNKDSARYAEMYGKTIRAFTEKLEVEQSVSFADILSKRKKNRQE